MNSNHSRKSAIYLRNSNSLDKLRSSESSIASKLRSIVLKNKIPPIQIPKNRQTLTFPNSACKAETPSLYLSPLSSLKNSIFLNEESSSQNFGKIRAYCSNTHKGLIREINEDRISIIPKIPKPSSCHLDHWPKCSYFGLFDGHGGKECSNFLKDNLHNLIIQSPFFPSDPSQAIFQGFHRAEQQFLEFSVKKKKKAGHAR